MALVRIAHLAPRYHIDLAQSLVDQAFPNRLHELVTVASFVALNVESSVVATAATA